MGRISPTRLSAHTNVSWSCKGQTWPVRLTLKAASLLVCDIMPWSAGEANILALRESGKACLEDMRNLESS